MTVTATAALISAGASGILTAVLTSCGLRQLRTPDQSNNRLPVVGAVVGALVGIAVVAAARRSDGLPLIPAFILWGSVLVAAGPCDAKTQRIPTVLIRPGFVAVLTLLAVGYATGRDWHGLAVAAVASLASATTRLVCWRFLGAGQGDVRMALLGGLGLGGADGRGLLVGFLVYTVAVVGQVVRQRPVSGSESAHIPMGQALAAGFISTRVISSLF